MKPTESRVIFEYIVMGDFNTDTHWWVESWIQGTDKVKILSSEDWSLCYTHENMEYSLSIFDCYPCASVCVDIKCLYTSVSAYSGLCDPISTYNP